MTASALALTAIVASGCDRLDSLLHTNQCALNGRTIHRGMKVRFQRDDGATEQACCLRCAINEARQTKTRLEVLSVTDYASGENISADHAVYVTGSKATLCAAQPVEVSAARREILMQSWDRCLPSVIAFAHDEDARRFQQEAGGVVQTFADLTRGTTVVAEGEP